MQQFTDSFEYAQARLKAKKEFEYRSLKDRILEGKLGHKSDADQIAWARYYTLSRELNKKPELF